jgi:hypothetical protein
LHRFAAIVRYGLESRFWGYRTTALDARFNNDEVGASAYGPRVMLNIVLLAYSRGLISSRVIEHACLHSVTGRLTGDTIMIT